MTRLLSLDTSGRSASDTVAFSAIYRIHLDGRLVTRLDTSGRSACDTVAFSAIYPIQIHLDGRLVTRLLSLLSIGYIWTVG